MMPRKKLPMAHLRTHQLYKDIFKGRHILLHRLHLDILLLRPSHQFGSGSAGLVYDDAHAVGTRANGFGPHERQRAQHSLGLEIEWLRRAEIDHIAAVGVMPYPLRGIHQKQLPIVLYTHQVAVICFAYILGGDKYRAPLFFKLPEMIPKLAPQDGINPGGRLVQEEQLRVVNQGGRQAETAQHTPRNISGQLSNGARTTLQISRLPSGVFPGTGSCHTAKRQS